MGRFLRRNRLALHGPGTMRLARAAAAPRIFARDVVEALAADPLRPALTYVDREGVIDRRTFADVAAAASRWAALLHTRGPNRATALVVVGKTACVARRSSSAR